MPTIKDYNQFQGLHWETGSLRNLLAFQGITAPHTNKPYSEAMLLGISGGIAMGYFTFAYQGYDPMVQILTRNTFEPLEKIYQRLEIKTNIRQSSNPAQGVSNLRQVLESGSPAIVFADSLSLPYNAFKPDKGMWAMLPILVYGYEEDQDRVSIADRSRKPLHVTTEELAVARGRTKKNKYRLQTHGSPNPEKLRSAVETGLRDCIQLFTGAPPKGSKNNFGFLAYRKWENLLRKANQRNSWAKDFSPGQKMYAGLTSAYNSIAIYGKEGGADRKLFSQFLQEASLLLDTKELTDIAKKFMKSADAWDDLAVALLPDNVPSFGETRELMWKKHYLFLEHGSTALEEMQQIDKRLDEIKSQVSEKFPINSSQAEEVRNVIADKIKAIHDIELDAVQDLHSVMP